MSLVCTDQTIFERLDVIRHEIMILNLRGTAIKVEGHSLPLSFFFLILMLFYDIFMSYTFM